jgi:hypothetical protein
MMVLLGTLSPTICFGLFMPATLEFLLGIFRRRRIWCVGFFLELGFDFSFKEVFRMIYRELGS